MTPVANLRKCSLSGWCDCWVCMQGAMCRLGREDCTWIHYLQILLFELNIVTDQDFGLPLFAGWRGSVLCVEERMKHIWLPYHGYQQKLAKHSSVPMLSLPWHTNRPQILIPLHRNRTKWLCSAQYNRMQIYPWFLGAIISCHQMQTMQWRASRF